MGTRFWKFGGCGLLAGAVLIAPLHAAILRRAVTLNGPDVRLSDLFGDAGANAGRVLGPGPQPGGRVIVGAAQLGAIARQFGVDWRPASAADQAVLDWPGRPLPREVVLTALHAALQNSGADPDAALEMPGFTPPLVPAGTEMSAVVSQLDYDSASGRFAAAVTVSGGSMNPVSLRVTGRVEPMVEVPVATTRLPAGAVLRAEDIRLARIRAVLVRGEAIARAEDAVGMQLRRPVSAGQPLAAGDLQRPALVQRRGNVQIVLESAGLLLTAQGVALEAGGTGDQVRVLNPVSHAVMLAEVIGPGRVRVAPGSVPLPASAQTAFMYGR